MKISWKTRLALDPRVSKVLISLVICLILYPFFGKYIIYPTYVFNAIYITAQLTKGATYKSSLSRIFGTIAGGLTGVILYFVMPNHFVVIPLAATLAVLWGYLFLGKFTPVVAVVAVMILTGKAAGEPVVYLNNRLFDTMIGLSIGFLVYFLYPRKKKQVSQVFDTSVKEFFCGDTADV